MGKSRKGLVRTLEEERDELCKLLFLEKDEWRRFRAHYDTVLTLEAEVERLRAVLWWLESTVRRTGISIHAEGFDYGEVQTAMLVAERASMGLDTPSFEWESLLESYRAAVHEGGNEK
jgi:hypothetical protein